MDVRFLIQGDTLCHKIPNFVAKGQTRRRHPQFSSAGKHQS